MGSDAASPGRVRAPAPWRARVTLASAVLLLLAGAAIAGCGLAGHGERAGPPQPPASAARDVHPAAGRALPRSAPADVVIPALHVRAPVMSLGLAPDGTVQVPPLAKADLAGWYDQGPAPGQLGPAVILGHVDSAATGPGVFYRLGALRPGDAVDLRRADNSTASFRVDSVERFGKDAFPTRRVYGDLDYAGIRLITCGGAFDRATGHYEDNVIAFGHLV